MKRFAIQPSIAASFLVVCVVGSSFGESEEFAAVATGSGEVADASNESPLGPSESDFEALRSSSPFVRILNPSETYTLKGVAMVDETHLATLYNRDTKKTVVVSPDKANEEGIQLVQIDPGRGLEGVTATISFAGEEVELKYELEGLFPAPGARGSEAPKGGGEGERRGPSKEDIERYKALSEEKRNQLRQYIGHIMRSYPNMSREERGNMIRGAVTRLSDGRELNIPAPDAGNGGAGPQSSPGQRPSSSGGPPQRR